MIDDNDDFRDAMNKALDRLGYLTGEGSFHGYRSEIWCVLTTFLKEAQASQASIVNSEGKDGGKDGGKLL